MKQQHNDSIKSKKAAELRQTFDHSFALPPSAASPEVQDLLTIRVLGNPYASRMESHGVAGRIQISEFTRQALTRPFSLEHRGVIEVKGKGEMSTWFLNNGSLN